MSRRRVVTRTVRAGRAGADRVDALVGLCERQDPAYRESVFPSSIRARVAIEQAATFGWERYVGSDGAVIGIDTFGASATLKDLQGRFGFTPERVVDLALERLAETGSQPDRRPRRGVA